MKITYYQATQRWVNFGSPETSPKFLRYESAIDWVRAQTHHFPGWRGIRMSDMYRLKLDDKLRELGKTINPHLNIDLGSGPFEKRHNCGIEWYSGWVTYVRDLEDGQTEEIKAEDNKETTISYTRRTYAKYVVRWEHVVQAEQKEDGKPYLPRKTEMREEILADIPLFFSQSWTGEITYYVDERGGEWSLGKPHFTTVYYSIYKNEEEYVE